MKNYMTAALTAILIAGLIVFSSQPASATVLVNFNAGTTYVTPKILDDFTRGSEMYGMEVTAYFANGFEEKVLWDDTGIDSGAAQGINWNVSLNLSSMTNPWQVSWHDVNLVGLLFDAKTGRATFDINWPKPSTPATYSGVTFTVTSNPNNLDFVATYSNLVAVDTLPPAGDLYRNLLVSWSGINLGTTGSFEFLADTDTIKKPISAPIPAPVPEPATLLLMGTGLAGLAGVRLRRNKK